MILRNDHQQIRKLFRDFRSAGENAQVEKKEIVDRIVSALTVHTYVENEGITDRPQTLTTDFFVNPVDMGTE